MTKLLIMATHLKSLTDMSGALGHMMVTFFAAMTAMHEDGSPFRQVTNAFSQEIALTTPAEGELAEAEQARQTVIDLVGERAAAMLADPSLIAKLHKNTQLDYTKSQREHNEKQIQQLTTKLRVSDCVGTVILSKNLRSLLACRRRTIRATR
jgi:hypothetical protein